MLDTNRFLLTITCLDPVLKFTFATRQVQCSSPVELHEALDSILTTDPVRKRIDMNPNWVWSEAAPEEPITE